MKRFLSNKRNVVLIAVLYSFLWGSAFPLVKICMEEFGATDNMSKCFVAGVRFTLSGILIALFSLCKDKTFFKTKKDYIYTVLLYGVLTALQYAFTYIGLSNVNGSVGAVFDQLCVFIIIIVSCLCFKNDKFNVAKFFGCILGFGGILLINTEGFEFRFELWGEGAMLFAAIIQSAAYFVAVLSANRLSAVKLVSFGQFTGGVLMIIFSLSRSIHIKIVTDTGLWVLVILSLISAVAYVLSLLPLRYFPASEISVFNLMITVFGVVMSAVVLGENVFRLNYLISFVLVSAGIFLVNTKNIRKGG